MILWQHGFEKCKDTGTKPTWERCLPATLEKALTPHGPDCSINTLLLQICTSEGVGLHQFISDIHRAMKTEKAEKFLQGQVQVNCWQNYWFCNTGSVLRTRYKKPRLWQIPTRDNFNIKTKLLHQWPAL